MNISPTITRALNTGLFRAQKYSPQILTAVGVVGVITAGVLAARATLKLENTLDNAKLRLDLAENNDRSKTKAVVANTLDLVKLYGPSVTLGVGSLVCIVSAQGILHRRNAALVVAYKGLETAYANYRGRVVEAYGEDTDRDFRLGLRDEEVEDEKGKKRVVKQLSEGDMGQFTFIFDQTNPNWHGSPTVNEFFLASMESVCNDLLRMRGHLFLSEVLDKLAIKRTPTSIHTGWIYNPDEDTRVNFNAVELDTPHARELEYLDRGTWLLDFNTQGPIWDKI